MHAPDTDLSIIGLQVVANSSKNYIMQLNRPSSTAKSCLSMNNLLNALQNDSDLSSLPRNELPQLFTSLFVATGSDYTSYFKNIGKATVINTFFMY